MSSRARDDLRERAFDQIQERPLTGVGFQEIKVAHTIYLQLWASGGLLAFSAFVLFAGGGLVVGWRLIRQRSLTSPERRLALALGVSFCGWLAAGLVSNVLTDGYVYVALALLLAIWVGHGRGEHASDRRPDATHHPAPIAGGSAPA